MGRCWSRWVVLVNERVTMSLPLLYTRSRGIGDTNDTKIELTLLWKAADEPVVVVVKQEIV